MWIDRPDKKALFINKLLSLDGQVLIVRGARQVGKTSFVLDALRSLQEYPQLNLNLLHPGSFQLGGKHYYGRDFFGRSGTGEEFLKNIELEFGEKLPQQKPSLIFVDEVDGHPQALESLQTLAEFTDRFKFVFTGSNLENIPVKNAATGRKANFDLYPITFREFARAGGDKNLCDYIGSVSFEEATYSQFYHDRAGELLKVYLRIGGMPKIVSAYLTSAKEIPEIARDLIVSIEENVKTVLGEKAKLYEYEDILRKMAFLSMNTLKYTNLQVQHAGRSEAKRLVAKTVGARVAHKIRLFETERDLSKYIIFDCGVVNYLLCGSNLLRNAINDRELGILYETLVGMELIAGMTTRDDLFYWKSGNVAEVEYILKAPRFAGIDVKAKKGSLRSLNSLAIFEKDVSHIVNICDEAPRIDLKYTATLPNYSGQRNVPLVTIPHYLTFRLFDMLN